MTLIAAVFPNSGGPFFISDIVLSIRDKDTPSKMTLPTVGYIGSDSRFNEIVGLSRKIHCIDKELVFLWTGKIAEAQQLANDVETELRVGKEPLEDAARFIRDTSVSDLSELQFFFLFGKPLEGDEERNGRYFLKKLKKVEFDGLGTVCVGGSGTEFFLNYLKNSERMFGLDFWKHPYAGIGLVGVLQGRELCYTQGLKDRWGGGFECTALTRHGFKPFTDILYANFYYSEEQVYLGGTFIKVDYIDDFLILRCIYKSTALTRRFVIPPLGRSKTDLPLERLKELPDMNCKFLCKIYHYKANSAGAFSSNARVDFNVERKHDLRIEVDGNSIVIHIPPRVHKDFLDEVVNFPKFGKH